MEDFGIKDYVEINGEKTYFYIQRKKVKNMNLKVHRDKRVTISIPMRMPEQKAKEFVRSKVDWIKKQQKFYDGYAEQKESQILEDGGIVYLLGKQYKIKIVADSKNSVNATGEIMEVHIKEKYVGSQDYIRKVYDSCLKEYALNVLEQVTLKYQQQMELYGIPMPKIEVRQMKSAWGLCMPKSNKVKFNLNLIKMPMYCIEYVVVHELSHFKHPNHSKSFYNFVEKFMMDWRERRKVLNESGVKVG